MKFSFNLLILKLGILFSLIFLLLGFRGIVFPYGHRILLEKAQWISESVILFFNETSIQRIFYVQLFYYIKLIGITNVLMDS